MDTDTQNVSGDSTPKTKHLTYTKVIGNFLADGLESVRSSYDRGEVSPAVLARAAEQLVGRKNVSDEALASLNAFVAEVTPEVKPSNGKRGKRGPVAGETRNYKAQETQNSSGPFLRLPLDVLGISKGEAVAVTFSVDGNSIDVRRAPVSTESAE